MSSAAQKQNSNKVQLLEGAGEVRADTQARDNVAEVTEVASRSQTTNPKRGGRRKFIFLALAAVVIGAGGYEGYQWWTNGRFMVSTDDAYIGGDIAYVSPKVTGYVEKVNVTANQKVKAGDTLVTLDQGDYQIALEQAEAQLATQEFAVKTIDAQEKVAEASLAQAKAQKQSATAALHSAQLTLDRTNKLQDQNFASTSALDSANTAFEQAQAQISSADAAIQSATANISAIHAQRAQAESTLKSLHLARDKAARDLEFTVLKAPFDGVVGNFAVQEGNLVSPGLRLMAVVPTSDLYIDANFKETQIAELHAGETVHISVDALPDQEFEGTVESISPASGSVFSLLPAENATGNFTKITQRLPVRIALPADVLATGRLKAGLSVVVDVDTRTGNDVSKVAVAN
ncbi:HlyD family secretion protein [Rhizobium sp. L1K21]|uniref:HlyD family secretion protein n=1 Tax=Rhizobium sp. L1K21 TaxID=2954933 RepID=UPI002092745C|nr:HlyD family secretion protein [Rhizobium sp. L1K21]MCO6184935.1 HlyD family secretion protein [Rhizobium sp. L1K21]